jgi:VanZ family protein
MRPTVENLGGPGSRGRDSAGRRAYLWPPLLAGTIVLVSGTQRLATPDIELVFSKDKLAHFLVFGLLATAILRTPPLRDLRLSSLLIAAGLTAAFGAFDELRQSFTPGRQVELADWLADAAGAIVAVCAYRWLHPYRRCLEWPMPQRHAPSPPGSVQRPG